VSLRVLLAYIELSPSVIVRVEETTAVRATCRTWSPFSALGGTLVTLLRFPRNEAVRGSSPRVGSLQQRDVRPATRFLALLLGQLGLADRGDE
jgi:hypothetical protein